MVTNTDWTVSCRCSHKIHANLHPSVSGATQNKRRAAKPYGAGPCLIAPNPCARRQPSGPGWRSVGSECCGDLCATRNPKLDSIQILGSVMGEAGSMTSSGSDSYAYFSIPNNCIVNSLHGTALTSSFWSLPSMFCLINYLRMLPPEHILGLDHAPTDFLHWLGVKGPRITNK